MSENRRSMTGAAPEENGADPQEQRLRALCEAASLPLRPSEALRQRIADLAARHDEVPRRGIELRFCRPGWGLAAGAAAVSLLLSLLGLVFTRGGLPGSNRSMTALIPHPPRNAPGPRSLSPVPENGAGAGGGEGQRMAPVLPRDKVRRPAPLVARREKETAGSQPPLAAPRPPSPDEDDLAYVNPDPEEMIRHWVTTTDDEWDRIEAGVRRTVRVRDDFIHIPFPRIAAASERQIAAAVEQYKKAAAVVDPRLSREVTLQLKGASLQEFCEAIEKQTGIRFSAARGIGDENVTALLKERPVREVMRAVARLFVYKWLRSGEEGAYRYELTQDLRAQLTEEEMRNRDLHAALINLDEQIRALEPHLDLSRAELKARWQNAQGADKEALRKIIGSEWGGFQLYRRLTPAQRASLAAGERLEFDPRATDPELRIPPEWRLPFLEASGLQIESFGGKPVISKLEDDGSRLTEVPGAMPTIGLQIERSELGQVELRISYGAYVEDRPELGSPRYTRTAPVVIGRNPGAAKPENARANASVRREPLFQRRTTVKPAPSCPQFAPGEKRREVYLGVIGGQSYTDVGGVLRTGKEEPPHVYTWDVWEAVHRETGQSIVADAYTRLFEQDRVTLESTTLFDALCRVGDAMGVRWTRDGDFLLARSTTYLWDKLKEVPRRHLARWQRHRKEQGALPLADLLEIATLSDRQLDSAWVGKPIDHCWGIEEWSVIGNAGFRPGISPEALRPYARFLATLPPALLSAAQRSDGLPFETLPPAPQEALARLLLQNGRPPRVLSGLRFRFDYVPAGQYVWHPSVSSYEEYEKARDWPLAAAATPQATLTAARRVYPGAQADEIRRSSGGLKLWFFTASGERWQLGEPSVGIRVPQ